MSPAKPARKPQKPAAPPATETSASCDVSRAVGLSMSTIFDLESIEDKDISGATRDADKAATLGKLAVEGLMIKRTHSEISADDLNLVQECIYTAAAHAWHAHTLQEADVAARRRIHPPLGEPVIHGKRVADCPVCGGAVLGEDLGCARCGARMHGECYWGRVVTLAEWQDFVRHINGGPDEYQGPPTVCAQCRAKDDPPPGVVPLRPKGA